MQQLEPDFKTLIAQAMAHPETADLPQLWRYAEQQLAGLEQDQRLKLAGEAIAQLCELYFARAEWLLSAWEERWSDRTLSEPVLSEEMLSSFLRQTMSLNLDEILDSVTHSRNRSPLEDSVVAEIEKAALLDWLEQDEHEKALAVAHDENVSEWIQAIQTWLEIHGRSARFSELIRNLQQQSQISLVSIWLGLLLGGFVLQPGEDFYAYDFTIRLGDAPDAHLAC